MCAYNPFVVVIHIHTQAQGHTQAHTLTLTHTTTQPHTHTHTHARTYARMHTHTHAHKQAHFCPEIIFILLPPSFSPLTPPINDLYSRYPRDIV